MHILGKVADLNVSANRILKSEQVWGKNGYKTELFVGNLCICWRSAGLRQTPPYLVTTRRFYFRQISWHVIGLCKHLAGVQLWVMVGFTCPLTQLCSVIKIKCTVTTIHHHAEGSSGTAFHKTARLMSFCVFMSPGWVKFLPQILWWTCGHRMCH